MMTVMSLRNEGTTSLLIMTDMDSGEQTAFRMDRDSAASLRDALEQWLTGDTGDWAKLG